MSPTIAVVAKLTRLRRLREEAALTQQELAEKSGVSRAALVKIESCESEPRASTLRKIAAALGARPRDLMEPIPSR
jgi:transcriptional regulator with XRE-family HTH domain